MYHKEGKLLVAILDKSPFFTELSIKERESLVLDLLEEYPQLCHQYNNELEVGYETGWFLNQSHNNK